ncbi:MAG TPA: ABC transporter permease [Bryobacteraceae bacterium]|jgi:predicted permease
MNIWQFIRHRRHREQDLDDEIQSHITMANRDRVECGEPREVSSFNVRREFGNVTLIKEVTREKWGWGGMERIWQDLRYSFRGLRKSPAFSLTAVAILGLGIGANTTVFSIANTVLLHPLPFSGAEEIVHVRRRTDFGSSSSFPMHDYVAIQARQNALSALAIADGVVGGYNLIGGGAPERVSGLHVSAQFFSVFAITPVTGRTFLQGDDQPGQPRLAVISQGLWTRRFEGAPSVIGKMLNVSGEAYTVIGVAPNSLSTFTASDIYLCLPVPAASTDRTNGFQVVGRLKPALPLAQAESQIDAIARRHAKTSSLTNMPQGIVLEQIQEEIAGRFRAALSVLFVAVVLVLLIACSNVANLVLARGAARHREIAVMAALGAPRSRIVDRLLAESFILAAAGGGLGLFLANLGVRGVAALAADRLPQISQVRVDFRTLIFAFAAAALSGILAGVAPALQLSRTNLTDALKQAAGRAGTSREGNRFRGVLVTLQVALSTVLLVGAILLLRSFWILSSVDPGFRPEHLLTMNISVSPERYPNSALVADYTEKVIQHLERLPGVAAASSTTTLPFEPDFDFPVTPVGGSTGRKELDAWYRAVNRQFFTAIGAPLLHGRAFNAGDTAGSAPVVIVNATLARKAFPNENAIGRALIIGEGYLTDPRELRQRTVVGIVGDTREEGLMYPAPGVIFVPAAQSPERITKIALEKIPTRWVIRTMGDTSKLMPAVRRAVLAADATQPASDLRTMDELLARHLAPNRFNLLMLAVFACIALALAAIGVYGLMSYSVSLRTREIGLRIALGAAPRSLVRALVWRGLRLAFTGVACGLVAALALGRLLGTLLFGVPSSDALTYAAVVGTLAVVMLLANYLPAARAAAVDPMAALREE